ncbi:hypothetical protein ACRAWD_00860 [Caulobacter segnis]
MALGSDTSTTSQLGLSRVSRRPRDPKPMVEGALGMARRPQLRDADDDRRGRGGQGRHGKRTTFRGRLMPVAGRRRRRRAAGRQAPAVHVRAGVFDGVDASIFAHVSLDFSTGWGRLAATTAWFPWNAPSAAGTPRGRPALGRSLGPGRPSRRSWTWPGTCAAWAFVCGEHLPLTQRSHYVITNGGGSAQHRPGRRATGLVAISARTPSSRSATSTSWATPFRRPLRLGPSGTTVEGNTACLGYAPRPTTATSRWPRSWPYATSRPLACPNGPPMIRRAFMARLCKVAQKFGRLQPLWPPRSLAGVACRRRDGRTACRWPGAARTTSART